MRYGVLRRDRFGGDAAKLPVHILGYGPLTESVFQVRALAAAVTHGGHALARGPRRGRVEPGGNGAAERLESRVTVVARDVRVQWINFAVR